MTKLILAIAIAGWGSCALMAQGAMPVARQNALVQKYCGVCHTDASMNGGLSLQHFDAASPDPTVMAMLVSKLKSQALGASGQPLPDRATQDALQNALTAESAGADTWTVTRTQNPKTQAPMLTASIVQEVPSAAQAAVQDLFRLTLTCGTATHEGEMQLAWSPGVPKSGQEISASVDGNTPVAYKVEGTEKMGNGQDGTSGPGAIVLRSTTLPAQTLTIRNVFPGETVEFPFAGLAETARHALSTCFSGSGVGN